MLRHEFGPGIFASLTIHAVFLSIVSFSWTKSPEMLQAFSVDIVTIKDFALESQAPIAANVVSKDLVLPKNAEPEEKPEPVATPEPVHQPKKAVKPDVVSSKSKPIAKTAAEQTENSAQKSSAAVGVAPHSTPQASGLPPGSGDHLAAARIGSLKASYEQAVASSLEKVKRYPRRALQRNLEGNVVLYLEIGRDGGVIERTIQKSSGFSFFDGEVLEMVERVGRFPRLPAEISSRSISYLVPVSFRLSN